MTSPVLEFSAVSKEYGGLRPIRIEKLIVGVADQVAIIGLDRPAAEILVNLATGATLADRGEVSVFGQQSQTIQTGAEWLSIVDRFGIVGERAVLLEGLSVVQNLAVPFSLDIEPPPDSIRERALTAGREVGLAETDWDRPVAQLDGSGRVRVRLARALALDPAIVLLEHPTAHVARSDAIPLGRAIRRVFDRRGIAALTMTADRDFAAAIASRVLTLDPATGKLAARNKWFFWRP